MTSPRTLSMTNLIHDFRLLVILFIAFRALLAVVYAPMLVNGVERGLTTGGDFQTYYQLAGLSEAGRLPFRDWWSEFPPIPSYLLTALYQLTGGRYETFALMFGALMLLCDIGNLVLLRRIGVRLHGDDTGMALAWVYALLLAPAVFVWWNFEPLVVFLTLLGLSWLLGGKLGRSALVIGIGALTKFTPALLLGAIWRYRQRGQALRYTAIAIGLFAAVYALLFAQNAAVTAPSLTAQFGKASYQTVWALLDGNYTTGNFGAASERLDPTSAATLRGNSPQIPNILRLTVAIAVGAWVFARTRRFDAVGLVAFVTLTLLIFYLQAQGWSTQWQAQIIPLALLALPQRETVLALVLLGGATFFEYPFLFSRTADTGGVISGSLTMPYVILILARTAILTGLSVALYRVLRQPTPETAR